MAFKIKQSCWHPLIGAGLAAALLAMPVTRAAADDPDVYGTIVSVRGNILEIRPMLRPINVRVAVDDKTMMVEDKRATPDSLKVGLRVECGGPYSKETSLHPDWVEVAEHPVGEMAEIYDGIKPRPSGRRARAGGTLKSVKPFTITDDKGHDITLELDQLQDYFRQSVIDRSALMIGVRVDATGPKAADGVIKATSIFPDRNFAQFGTMFGTITGRHGNVVDMRPRFQTESIHVTLQDHCLMQREVHVDPDSVKIGDTVTFWGYQRDQVWQQHKSKDLNAIALLIGNERYPQSATDGDEVPVFLTGKLALLEPAVQLALPSGKRITVIIPSQMPVASLKPAVIGDIKPGTPAMFVLTRDAAGGFSTRTIMLDASPWVGYGQ